MMTAHLPSPALTAPVAQRPSEFQRALDAGAPYDALADLVWACVEAGVTPSVEVLVFFQPTSDGGRVADGDVPTDAVLGGEITTLLGIIANTCSPAHGGGEIAAMVVARLPRLLELVNGYALTPGLSRTAARSDMKAWREMTTPGVAPVTAYVALRGIRKR